MLSVGGWLTDGVCRKLVTDVSVGCLSGCCPLVALMPLPVKTAVAGDLRVDFLDTKRLDCLSSADLMLLTYIR